MESLDKFPEGLRLLFIDLAEHFMNSRQDILCCEVDLRQYQVLEMIINAIPNSRFAQIIFYVFYHDTDNAVIQSHLWGRFVEERISEPQMMTDKLSIGYLLTDPTQIQLMDGTPILIESLFDMEFRKRTIQRIYQILIQKLENKKNRKILNYVREMGKMERTLKLFQHD